ncbi:MAG: hypothetical protein CMF69_11835 [Magnetovibrio sp.]|nr:hypothetical protein [Magnetovibrio sp.]|tara:strand:+ start:1253 stop:1756 length:504 start_codon:yes stop_codon:yes gene_type:complete
MDKQSRYTNNPVKLRSNRSQHLGRSIGRLTKPLFGKRGLADGTIARDWVSIASHAIAAHSQPIKITYSGHQRTGGLLHLRIDNSAMATQLQHLEPQLIERINRFFGYQAVSRLRYIHGPLPKPLLPVRQRNQKKLSRQQHQRLSSILDGIKDSELRQALEKLGRSLM